MAQANEVDILVKTKADTQELNRATKETKEYGDKLEATGEQAGAAETRLIGIHDVIDGTATVMQGPGQQGMVAYIQGWADIAGGVEGVLPLLKAMSIEAIKNAATQVASAARTVGSWVVMRAQATVTGIQMAAAWALSLGPIALVLAALAVIGGAIAILWAKSQTFRNIVSGAFGDVRDAVHAVWNWIDNLMRKFGPLIDAVRTVIKLALGPFIAAWNGVRDAISFVNRLVDDFLIKSGIVKKQGQVFTPELVATITHPGGGTGGRGAGGSSRSPGYARGGISPGGRITVNERGPEDITLPAGARISSNADTVSGYGGGGGYMQIHVTDDGSAFAKLVANTIRKSIRDQGGGSTQRYLGFA